MAGHRYRLLGPLKVSTDDGRTVAIKGPQAQLVLSHLLVASGRVVPAGALVETVWGEEPPHSAAGSIQALISRLRKELGAEGERLVYEGGGYRLAVEAERVDAHRFEALCAAGRAALTNGDPHEASRLLSDAEAMWHGDALAGLGGGFAETTAGRLEELRVAATEDRCEAELRLGRGAEVVPLLTELVSRAPLRERARGQLARALYQSGRQADALEELERARRVLVEELGIDLSRELRDLQQQILQQHPDLDAAPAPQGTPTQAGMAQRAGGGVILDRPTNPLVGRVPELASIVSVVDRAFDASGSLQHLVIEGEPGIGKTRLAQEALRLAETRGARTLTAVTLEGGFGPAFGPWLHLMREVRLRTGHSPQPVAHLLDGRETRNESLAGGVVEALVGFAGDSGLAVLIDDLQWADPASLELLLAVAGRLDSERVLFILTVRQVGTVHSDEVTSTLAHLTRDPDTVRMTLRGLSLTECGQLLTETGESAVADHDVRLLYERSDGNPFFASELARLMREDGAMGGVPTGVRDVLQRRLGLLPKATTDLLEVAAVIGRQVDVGLLCRVTDRELEDCLDDLEPAVDKRLLEVPSTGAGSVRFSHALVRESLVDATSPLRRARLHLRAADAILDIFGETDDTAEVVAEHLWLAAVVGAGRRAAAALERAAEVALRRQALGSALALLDRSAQLYRAAGADGLEGELRVLRLLAFVEGTKVGYRAARSSATSERIRALARSAGNVELMLDVLWTEWAGCDTGGEPERAIEIAEEAGRLLDVRSTPALEAGVAAMRGFSLRHLGRMRESLEETRRSVRLFEEAGPQPEAASYLNSSITAQGYRFFAEALTVGHDETELERVFRGHQLPFARLVISMFGAATATATADVDALRRWADRMQGTETDLVMSFWTGSAEVYAALSDLHWGAVDDGRRRLDTGRRMMAEAEATAMLAGAQAEAARAFARHGLLTEADAAVTEARRILDEHGERCYAPLVEFAAAEVAAAHGRLDEAARRRDDAVRVARSQGSDALADRLLRWLPAQ